MLNGIQDPHEHSFLLQTFVRNVLANITGRKIAGKTGQGFLLFNVLLVLFAVALLIKGYYFGIRVLQFYQESGL